MRILIALFFLALPAAAQELSDNYNVIGQMDVVIDGVPTVLPIATMSEHNVSFAEIQEFMGKQVATITGVTPEDGEYSHPMLAFTLSLSGTGLGFLNSVQLLEIGQDSKHMTEASLGHGNLSITNYNRDAGAFEFDFTAELIRLVADENWDITVEEGKSAVRIEGHVSVNIPPAFWPEG